MHAPVDLTHSWEIGFRVLRAPHLLTTASFPVPVAVDTPTFPPPARRKPVATSVPPAKEHRATAFFRTADSAVPAVLLSALHAEAQKKEAAAAVSAATAAAAARNKGAPIKLMRRSPGDPRARSSQQGQAGGGLEKQVKTVEDREREYAEARARIFGTRSPTGPPTPPQPSSASGASAHGTPVPSGGSAQSMGNSSVDSPQRSTVTAASGTAAAGEGTAEAGSPLDASGAKGASVANGKGAGASAAGPLAGTASVGKTPTKTSGGAGGAGPGGAGEGQAKMAPAATGVKDAPSTPSAGSSVTPVRKAGEAKQAGGATTSQGPDGTPGFSRGRGKPIAKDEGERVVAGGARLQDTESGDKGNGVTDHNRTGGQGGRGGGGITPGGRGGGGRGNRRPAVNAGEWKGQRGMQRNRVAEMSDPDFVRNYENYRPSFAPYRQLAEPGGFASVQGQAQPRLLQHQVCDELVGSWGDGRGTHCGWSHGACLVPETVVWYCMGASLSLLNLCLHSPAPCVPERRAVRSM